MDMEDFSDCIETFESVNNNLNSVEVILSELLNVNQEEIREHLIKNANTLECSTNYKIRDNIQLWFQNYSAFNCWVNDEYNS